MKKIKIWFDGMDGNFDFENNFITKVLKKKYDVELSESPEVVFISVKTRNPYKYNCIRVYYTAENLVPDFNICDYGIGFHYIEFEDRYIRFPVYLVDGFIAYEKDDYASDLILARQKHKMVDAILEYKSDFCSFVYSNAEGVPCRERMFEALTQYQTVSSGGRYRNNVGGGIESKLEFQKKHKFVIAFENTSTSGYTTEKIVGAFAANAVPIYWGNPQISREFNSESFINCHDFGLTEKGEQEAIDKIIEEVKRIDQDEELYLKMLSTPAFKNENDVLLQQTQFENFLYNIFDQPLEKAYRRNRFYWGERYERKQRIGNIFYLFCRKFIPIRNFIQKLL